MRALAAIAVAAFAIGALGSCTWERRLIEGAEEAIGEGPFYALPTPMPSGDPGDVVRSERLASAPDGVVAYRVVYHSLDAHGDDALVSGVVAALDDPAPAGGRTVVSWGHPTTGTAPRCAPSNGIDPFDLIEGFGDLIAAGYTVAATDYSGMGIEGPDSYLISDVEGRNMLDIVRAVQQFDDLGASERVALWGHSQGGHAVLAAADLADDYAPELEVQAASVAAPAADLTALLDADLDTISGVSIGSYAFTAYADVYAGSDGAELSTILTPEAVAAVPKMADLCLLGQNSELHDLGQPLIGNFVSSDPATTEPWASLLARNTPGADGFTIPLFVAQGATDTLVHPDLTKAYVERQQSLGTDVTFLSIPDTGHGLVADRAMPTLMPWLAEHAPPTGG
ncbi:S9 family peptidase [Agromyces sp. LHK192]|uniref:alpha/beta hydrolase family protein n=1 Tax=Agromyces sp. LHK192 TaxID=2498704 RepID=UPI00196AE670|nr:alpha/beta fold hydrolase [Agromyces sp. LHK192]